MLQEHIRTITAIVNKLNNDIAVSTTGNARSMLQEHIRTITAIVNKLNNDIAVSTR